MSRVDTPKDFEVSQQVFQTCSRGYVILISQSRSRKPGSNMEERLTEIRWSATRQKKQKPSEKTLTSIHCKDPSMKWQNGDRGTDYNVESKNFITEKGEDSGGWSHPEELTTYSRWICGQFVFVLRFLPRPAEYNFSAILQWILRHRAGYGIL